MEINIIIPTPLRKYVDNQKKIACSAATVEEAFVVLKEKSENLIDHIIDKDGSLREFICVFVNKNEIDKRNGLSTELKEGDVISIIPAFAGG